MVVADQKQEGYEQIFTQEDHSGDSVSKSLGNHYHFMSKPLRAFMVALP